MTKSFEIENLHIDGDFIKFDFGGETHSYKLERQPTIEERVEALERRMDVVEAMNLRQGEVERFGCGCPANF